MKKRWTSGLLSLLLVLLLFSGCSALEALELIKDRDGPESSNSSVSEPSSVSSSGRLRPAAKGQPFRRTNGNRSQIPWTLKMKTPCARHWRASGPTASRLRTTRQHGSHFPGRAGTACGSGTRRTMPYWNIGASVSWNTGKPGKGKLPI